MENQIPLDGTKPTSVACAPYGTPAKTTAKKIERKKLETGQFFDPNRTKRSDVKVVIAKCGVFPPNALQVFEIFGNVAEMIDEKGIAKGGSWKHPKEECTVEKDFTYDIPNNWLGFRCACNKVGL